MPATNERNTRQRIAIRDAIEAAGAPVSPREILTAASRRAGGLGLATVYRTIKLLVDAGEVQAVEIPGQSTRYELAGKHHHHHFHCRSCGKVYELEGCCGHFAELTPSGFELGGHDLTLFGRCRACVGGPEKGGRGRGV
ncbi:MAG TPA: transcriptional repressor [Phycisphaerales bacterium]|nr:transcriptional repressor [Phycisphaerales bacterium]